ncbi:hypothetical protein AM501_10055 [Aneurinibacillus migulanus]|uniref:hypothetical protein n=1 Tax=Aneurinibacillus migulanus TaxID=47500 RepID=UPI0005BB352C|nr:hypothetical protein [Aneurinibacillus migulanus]KIV56481.1 hypothetical protein TS64_09470 [Aneurinibacillus migulanus]KPD08489.1 hypothetical protein AM501_10055 [Aneurinibacillus migulanus]
MIDVKDIQENQVVYLFDDHFFEILACKVERNEAFTPPYILRHKNLSAGGVPLESEIRNLYTNLEEAQIHFNSELEKWREKISHWKYKGLYLCDDCGYEYVVKSEAEKLPNFCPYCGSKDIFSRVPIFHK